MKYFLYAHKSADDEDPQILSIEAQLAELRAFAKRENLFVYKELVEKCTAKERMPRSFISFLVIYLSS